MLPKHFIHHGTLREIILAEGTARGSSLPPSGEVVCDERMVIPGEVRKDSWPEDALFHMLVALDSYRLRLRSVHGDTIRAFGWVTLWGRRCLEQHPAHPFRSEFVEHVRRDCEVLACGVRESRSWISPERVHSALTVASFCSRQLDALPLFLPKPQPHA